MTEATPRQMQTVAFLGNYMPRKCGIATFTTDVCRSVVAQYPQIRSFVIPVNDLDEGYDYPPEVRFEIVERDLSSYQRAADFLNISNVDVVCVQHEYGIYGGPAGSHVLALLRDLRMPVVTTLHTILASPNDDQRRVMDDLLDISSRVVTMTQRGVSMLREIYGVPEEKIDLIPHGIPDMPFVDPNFYKDQFGVEGKTVLLTFGLLSPSKGIEHVLNALPEIVKEFPDTVYIVLGATHPNLLRERGEAYRISLERLAKKNNVQKHVIFFNQFVELEELKEFIGAADIYLVPYLNEAQAVSGTLAYSFGAGKAVVSTPFWHAEELLAEQRGVLVPFADPAAIAREVTALLRDDTRRHAMRRNAYKLSREMVWSQVAHMYVQTFERAREEKAETFRSPVAIRTLEERRGDLEEIKVDHLLRMTDSTGLLQHATFTVPNYAEGYCTDDNARALILTLLMEELGEIGSPIQTASFHYAAFLGHAFNPATGRFRNFMGIDRCWKEDAGSEDSHARALWALGTCIGRSHNSMLQTWAAQLFERALPPVMQMTSPRAWAFALVGIHEYFRRLSGDRLVNQLRDALTQRLMERFRDASNDDWPWFEESLTYVNAKLPHALILSGRWTNRPEILNTGIRALRWLVDIQTSPTGCFHPIGSAGFSSRGQTLPQSDQQPIEAQAMISACLEAYRSTTDTHWAEQAQRAFDWFLGRNDLGIELYDPISGGCRDGLHVDRVNQNQGAESTLAFLLALAEMRQHQNILLSFTKPVRAGSERNVS